MRISDWSSDVCSSDLDQLVQHDGALRVLDFTVLLEHFIVPARGDANVLLAQQAGSQNGCGRIAGEFILLLHVQGGHGLIALVVETYAGHPAHHHAAAFDRRAHFKAAHIVEVRLNLVGWSSEEHTSDLQSLMRKSTAVFCLKKT